MKKILFLTLLSLFIIPAFAAITVEESTDAECLINAGYSQSFAEDVFISKNRGTSKPIESLYEKSSNKFVRAWKSFFAYIDPALESADRVHHDIKLSPAVSDL